MEQMNLSMISEKYRSHTAFTPINFKNITLNGKLVRSATEFFIALPDGHVAQAEFSAYEKLADQPLGLIICGHTCVSPEGRSNLKQNAIWNDEFIDDHKRIVKIVKAGKCAPKIILQIGHGGMKAANHNGDRPVYTPDNMTESQIHETVKAFAAAAYRAKICGFDGVQLHGAHMYLLSQFFYKQYNHRTDKYGGNGLNRFRIVSEIADEVKKVCGDEFPVFIKINGDNIIDGAEYFSDLCEAADICLKCGLEGLELSGYDSQPAGPILKPFFFETAAKLMERTQLPVMLVGGIRTIADIENVLSSGIYTASICRPLLSEYNYIEKLFSGKDTQ